MKKIGYMLFVLALGVQVASCQQATGYKTVDEKEFSVMSKQENAVILDVRTPEEFGEGHLENATLVNYNGFDFEEQIKKLDKSKTYLVYCRSGRRSADASAKMSQLGLNVFNLDGGIVSWTGKVVK